MKRALKISAVVFAVALVLWACGSASPKQVAEKFLNAMSSGDYETAKKLASKDSQVAVGLAEANSKGKPAEAKKIEIGDETISDNSATVKYKEDGEDRTLKLVKEDGSWKASWSKDDMDAGPEANAESFLKAMAKGDYEEAKKFATNDAVASIDMMAATADSKKANPDKIEMGTTDVNGTTAVVHYKENGVDKTLDMIKEKGKWKAAWTKSSGSSGLEDLGDDLEEAVEESKSDSE